jgi:hypothetical protein
MADPRPARAPLGADRPRLVVVDELALTTPTDPYYSLRALGAYSPKSPPPLFSHHTKAEGQASP